MKYLILTEGECELGLINVLLEKNMMIYSFDDLVYERAYHERQLTDKIKERINSLPYDEKITIIRIGDKLTDSINIPPEYKEKIVEQIKVCTKPEFEILHIIHKKKINEFIHRKTEIYASEYLKSIDKTYKKTRDYNYNYFNSPK